MLIIVSLLLMIFLNLSSDTIILTLGDEKTILSQKDIERTFPKVLLGYVRKNTDAHIFVIHGPGSFTTLRIGCMVLNEINLLMNYTLRFWACSKPDLYAIAYKKWLLPQYGYIYIWQRQNVRKTDLSTMSHTKLPCQSLHEDSLSTRVYFLDTVQEHELIKHVDTWYMVGISLSADAQHIELSYAWNTWIYALQEFCSAPTPSISPAYLIEPTLGGN